MNRKAGNYSGINTCAGAHSSSEGPKSQRTVSYFHFTLFLTYVSFTDISNNKPAR